MLRKITAPKIYTLNGEVHTNHALIVKSDGTIKDIVSLENLEGVEHYEGILCPGFINTHCHLELSHMKGLVNTGTGLLHFIGDVVKYRNFPDDVVQEAIRKGDAEMRANGIVAVGDISNAVDTAATKAASDIKYYTFVEMFDFMQANMTASTIERYEEVYAAHSNENGNRKAYVPHAPYTVSDELYQYVDQQSGEDLTISIHNQETPHEDALFQSKEGDFLDFYTSLGFSLDAFESKNSSSLAYAIQHLPKQHRTLFVHNTMTTAQDIALANAWSNNVYWATCANANLYIENRLPNYQTFIDANAKMTIGTDSLTSNWQLSIVEEMKTIQKYCSYISFETLLTWACKNGAEALGFDRELGTIEVGKKPGIVNITNIEWQNDDANLTNAQSNRII